MLANKGTFFAIIPKMKAARAVGREPVIADGLGGDSSIVFTQSNFPLELITCRDLHHDVSKGDSFFIHDDFVNVDRKAQC